MTLRSLLASGLCAFAKSLTGVRSIWQGCQPEAKQRVYFANHRSHVDFLLIWASLPATLRATTRPVAAADYWQSGAVRQYLGCQVFNSVLIDRSYRKRGESPLDAMNRALGRGDSLIIFPEGTRNLGDAVLPFKSGLYHLAAANTQVEFVPVWIENLGRVMPKGTVIPVPLLCSVTFGTPMHLGDAETKDAFLTRARETLLSLAPSEE